MVLTGKDIMSWANGHKADAMRPDELKAEGNPHDEYDDLDYEEGTSERNEIWAGEHPNPEEISEEEAEEFVGWLEENEPEIAVAVKDIAEAVVDEDVAMIEQGLDELKQATQFLNPEYPPMPEAKKDEAAEGIAKHMREKGHPPKGSKAWKQAVAIGMSEARRGEEEAVAP